MRPRIPVARLAFPSLLAAFLAAACSPEHHGVSAVGVTCTQAPLHYHIAVDRSGTMAAHWRTAASGVTTAIRHVPDGALLHVYTFAGNIQPLGEWTVRAGEMDRIIREVQEAMGDTASGAKTHIHGMADTLAGRVRAAPDARHVVFFVSDDDDDPPAGYSAEDRERVRSAWTALGRRIPDSLRVVAVRLGAHSTFLSMVPRADRTPVSEISSLGTTIAQRLEDDPFARQRRRERREPLLSAALVPGSQAVPYPGGDVRIMLVSRAECGSYRLADGTAIGPGDTLYVTTRVRSPLGLRRALFGSASPAVSVAEALPPDIVRPRVTNYGPANGSSFRDTAYADGGHDLAAVEGEIVFTPAPLWVRVIAGIIVLLFVAFAILAIVLPLIPPLGGKLRATLRLDPNDVEVDLTPARAGREINVPPPPLAPSIRVRVARASRWGNPWKTVLVFRVVGEGSVGVAKEDGDTGKYQVDWLASEESREVRGPVFILWPRAADAQRPQELGQPENYPGYEWKP